MKKVLLFLLVILSFQITAKEEEVRIWYQNGILTEVGITIEEIVDLRNVKIDEKNKTEIEMKNYKFYVNKNDLMEEHNNNASNVRNKIAKIDNVGSKIDKKQLQNIDFRETLFELIKNRKVLVYDKKKKKYLEEVAICSGYSQYENEKRKDFSGYIYEKLVYSKDLNDKIVIPYWIYHYSGVKKNNKSKNDIEANGNKKISERQEKIAKFTEEAKKYPGKKFKFRINE